MDTAPSPATRCCRPQPPPLTERGAVKWLRENLFSGPLNIVLTVVGALDHLLPGHRRRCPGG